MISRRTKGQIRGHTKNKRKRFNTPVNQICVSTNYYAALQAYSETNRYDIETNTVTEYELTDISRDQKANLNNSGKYNATTKERAADSSKQLKAQHNLQNPKKNQNSVWKKRN